MLVRGDGTRLDEKLVDAHQSNDVPAWHVLNGLSISTHHQNRPKGGGGREKRLIFDKLH